MTIPYIPRSRRDFFRSRESKLVSAIDDSYDLALLPPTLEEHLSVEGGPVTEAIKKVLDETRYRKPLAEEKKPY